MRTLLMSTTPRRGQQLGLSKEESKENVPKANSLLS